MVKSPLCESGDCLNLADGRYCGNHAEKHDPERDARDRLHASPAYRSWRASYDIYLGTLKETQSDQMGGYREIPGCSGDDEDPRGVYA